MGSASGVEVVMRVIRIGLIARADRTGLGAQTHDFFRHMNPAKVLVVNLEHLNGQKVDPTMYPGAPILRWTPYPAVREGAFEMREVFNEFLNNLDLVVTAETPYDYYLFSEARRRGIKTVLQYNFELLDNLSNPSAEVPDLFMAPSRWRYDDVPFANKCFIPVPVDTVRFPFTHRKEAGTFFHPGGVPALEDRNGTNSVMGCWPHVKSDSRLIVRTPRSVQHSDSRVEIQSGLVDRHEDLYHGGDTFVMPRKYAGLCLPLNEAIALGMPVIMTELSPQDQFLHPASLVPTTPYIKTVFTKTWVHVHEVDQLKLAAKIDQFADSPDLVSEVSAWSGELGRVLSWDNMKPIYDATFESLLDGQVPKSFVWPTPPGR